MHYKAWLPRRASCRHPHVLAPQDEGLTCIQLDLSNQESIEQAAQLAIELAPNNGYRQTDK